MDSQTTRALLMARAQLVSQRQTTANLIRGLLKTFETAQKVVARRCSIFSVKSLIH